MKKNYYIGLISIFFILATFSSVFVSKSSIFVLNENMDNVNKKKIIIIDAGHGGMDGGAAGKTGVLEREINLQIAKKLDEVLTLAGFKTVMIRTDENDLSSEGKTIREKKRSDLQNRINTANKYPDGIFISIHQNTFTDSRYYGAQVFYNNDGSKEIAKKTQENLKMFLDKNNKREIKQIPSEILIMKNIKCQGILIECGFLSNEEEELLLLNSGYQLKIALAILKSLY